MSKKTPKKGKRKKRKKVDHEREVTQYISTASISLGAAHYHAKQLRDMDLARDIMSIALKCEELESFLSGKTIKRLGDEI